jgi:hypothetical protein
MHTEGRCRCNAIYGMIQVGTNTMARLFRVLWKEANGEEYEENDLRDMQSQSTVDLHEKIRGRGWTPLLMKHWNVQKMCDALDVMLPKGKTVFCENMRKSGHCRFGARCHYAHHESEMDNPKKSKLYKTVLCNVPCCTRKFCAFAHGEGELRAAPPDVHIPRARFECLVQDKLVTQEDLQKKYLAHFLGAGESLRDAVDTVRAIRNIMSHTRGDVDVRNLMPATSELIVELLETAFTCCAKAAGGTCLADFEAEKAAMLAQIPAPVMSAKKPLVTEAGWSFPEVPEGAKEPGGIESWDEATVEQFFVRCHFPTKGLRDNQVDGLSLVELFQDKDQEKNFCSSVEEGGLGFTKLLFKGRFKKEMMLLGVVEAKK